VKKIYFMFFICLITTISFAEPPSKKEYIPTIESYAYIEGKFSGVEIAPIIESFYTWINETRGDIKINPPTVEQRNYFYKVLKPSIIDDENLHLDYTKNPKIAWGNSCSKNFFILRVLSNDPTVMLIENSKNSDNENESKKGILAYTFLGCRYKYIAIVADRIIDEEMFKSVIIHELGHMWGLPDNEKGNQSIMNSSYPMSTCITKSDLEDLYEIHGKKEKVKFFGGCNPKN